MTETELPGSPSDEIASVLATGRCPASEIFVSLSARDPQGRDADYLRWHTFDHRPEQYRLAALRGSMRLVSPPECRAVRAVQDPRYDAVDHVMSYLFADLSSMRGFNDLAVALGGADRIPFLLPLVERGLFHLDGRAAASRIKVGADVLAWWPYQGVYLLIEDGEAASSDLLEAPGVAGVWWGTGFQLDPAYPSADGQKISESEGLQITYCFLDDDPVATAARLRPTLEKRWGSHKDLVPLLAAPFYPVTGDNYDHHLP